MNPVKKIQQFTNETAGELKKCTWPSRRELMESTIVVTVSILMIGAFVFIVDMIMKYVNQLLAG